MNANKAQRPGGYRALAATVAEATTKDALIVTQKATKSQATQLAPKSVARHTFTFRLKQNGGHHG